MTMKWIERFESTINWAVLLMMAVVVLMLTAGFAVDIGRNATMFLRGSMTPEEVFAIFGDLLLILIGLELMHTVKAYLVDHAVHVEVILTVAIVAMARKVIVANLNEYPGTAIIGMALLIIALAGSHWLLVRRNFGDKP
jgi:uncharacterized membrane protein (DUF373 family)